MAFEKNTLVGNGVRLEPLSMKHKDGLVEAVKDGDLWKFFVTLLPRPEDVEAFIENALSAYARGDGIVYATID